VLLAAGQGGNGFAVAVAAELLELLVIGDEVLGVDVVELLLED